MFRRIERHIPAIFLVSLAALTLGVGVAVRHARDLARTEGWVVHTYDVIATLGDLESGLRDAESAERGFALTGDSTLLPAFAHGPGRTSERLARVHELVADNPVQLRRTAVLAGLVDQKLDAMDAVVRARREAGARAAAAMVADGRAPRAMRQVAAAIDTMQGDELRLLAVRRAALGASTRRATLLVELLGGGAVVMLALAFLSISGARARQRAAETRAAAVHEEVRARVAELERRGREARTLSELSEALQLCLTPTEAYAAAAAGIPAVLGSTTGGGLLAVVRSSRNRVERVAGWGTLAGDDLVAFAPEDCCALRSGRQYLARAGESRLRCAHLPADIGDYVCLPLAAHGETLGILHVSGTAVGAWVGHDGRDPLALLRDAGQHVAVALANLALRDRLKQQSIRDALTGSFNRRYFEESLDREVARARRHRHTLGLVMVDVDHFKRINDRHGHEAGDEVLRVAAEVLRRAVREEDVVCRYGGEEFAILLPDISEEVALARAQGILEALRAQRIVHRGEPMGPVTASAGVAVFPLHGDDGVDVLRRADEALYAAKRAGRDRVVAAGA